MEDYENSRFSRERAEEPLAENSLDGAPCALWNGTHTRRASWLPVKTTDACRLSRSGMTFKPLTESHGADVLTWYLEDSLAKTFPPPVKAPESKASGAECGNTWRESSVRFDLDSRSWKTHLCLWEEGLPLSSVILPQWGMMRDGVLWERTKPEHLTSGTESGLWPTPRSCSAMAATITEQSAWAENRFPNLETIVGRRMWPTPRANESTESRETQAAREARGTKASKNLTAEVGGGQLNPTWVEWLMGWPLGWTDCAASATAKFRQWCASHGKH